MNWLDWARLVRIPTVFTILADVSAAFLLVSGGVQPLSRFVCIVLAGVCLYWSGMIFNDIFDVEQDRAERPTRPLASGAIRLGIAKTAGAFLMACGIAFACASGYLPSMEVESTWRPALIACLLAVAILLYDGPLKKTPLGPLAMGSCRVLSFLLGASPVLSGPLPEALFPQHVLVAAMGMGVYVMGITLLARREAGETTKQVVLVGMIVMTLGCVLLAMAPRFAEVGVQFRFLGDSRFALLIGMLGFTVVYRAAGLLTDPSPKRVQLSVKLALLTLIPLYAAFAMLGAGAMAGLIVFALVIPAMVVSMKFGMT